MIEEKILQLLLLSFLLWITPPRYIKEIPKNKEWDILNPSIGFSTVKKCFGSNSGVLEMFWRRANG
jgi:hypothetical protein